MATITISMPDSLREFVETQVSTRGYGNVSEYFRALIREAQEREADARLQALLLEGLDSGDEVEVSPEFWRELRAEAARRIAERHPR